MGGFAKGSIPQEEWLSHAQKMSGVEDEKPFQESEVQYLKWIDKMGVLSAEAELDAAQQKLEELLQHVDAALPEDETAAADWKKAASADQDIDENYAAQLEDKYDPERQSKGSKNTSALSEKVASHAKWERDRGTDNKEFQKNIKTREAKREVARD